MSLVDYASSSSSDEDEPQAPPAPRRRQVKDDDEQINENPPNIQHHPSSTTPPPKGNPLHAQISRSLGPSSKQKEIVSSQSSKLKLPDASFLLDSPAVPSNLLNALDHSSRVAAAMAESAARKRELNGSPATYPRSKVPRGTLPHSKRVPDTVDGRLLPPQLTGRSNIVTEDISKLFVRKHSDSSTE
ncbi:hypothetical protein BUALT_Bualt01G0159900 [Buddleja alternifolia]|uniref:Uncharacterized protein n=1 Tax=Buddleja alternifolia TaxID=168488 RepID=A0AAV6YIG0_9LAMI|nr:hypothetical protein BUALT_Bualt01G0159900 [Buddleja alternifolia]